MKRSVVVLSVMTLVMIGCSADNTSKEHKSYNTNDRYKSEETLTNVAKNVWIAVSDGTWSLVYLKTTKDFKTYVSEEDFVEVKSTCNKNLRGKRFEIENVNLSLSNPSLGNVTVTAKNFRNNQTYRYNYETRTWELVPEEWEYDFFTDFTAEEHIIALGRDDMCNA